MELLVLGVRHHGPGSARAVLRALDRARPDLVVIEGPPELDVLVAHVGSAELRPPVAALVHVVDEPGRAAFYPFARFSPEWVALRWATSVGVPVRFADLPAAHDLAHAGSGPVPTRAKAGAGPEASAQRGPVHADEPGPAAGRPGPSVRADPLGALALAAGYDDPERWWEDVVELRGEDCFVAVGEAMAALREVDGTLEGREAQREAAMRRRLREADREGFAAVAMVCGAWHAPALELARFPPAARDNALLSGLPKVKVNATWVPWTHRNLARTSGYGAGVTSPGWYHHCFAQPVDTVVRWLARTAAMLRDERMEVSPAAIIEAARLADTLAAVRGRPEPGLGEVVDATRAVLLGGADAPLQLVVDRLLVGDDIGHVPDDAPKVPLARDLEAAQRRLRLKPEAAVRTLELDLRRPLDRDRSALLRRLLLLGIRWGEPTDPLSRSKGSFKEPWQLEWRPELAVALIEAARHGTTVPNAATAALAARASETRSLVELAALVEQALLADLSEGLAVAMGLLADVAALDHDVSHLMDAVEPLARVTRYGDVRRTDATRVGAVLAGLVDRIAVGLRAASASLDDSAADALRERVDQVTRAVALVDGGPAEPEVGGGPAEPEVGGGPGSGDRPGPGAGPLAGLRDRWETALAGVADRPDVHGSVAGRVNRILLDAGRLPASEANTRLGLVLTTAGDPARAGAYLEGFLAGGALLLLHDPELLAVVDAWVTGTPSSRFDDVLPLVRRAFASFTSAERRQVGQQLAQLGGIGRRPGPDGDADIDPDRAALVLPTLRLLLGVRP